MKSKTSGFAIAALVLGIFSLLLSWLLIFGLIVTFTTFVIGIIAIKDTKSKPGRELAIAGLVLSSIAILIGIFVTAVGFLAFTGVLSPDNLIPERCILMSGMFCKDHRVTQNDVTLAVSNSIGRDIIIEKVDIGGECSSNDSVILQNGEDTVLQVSGCNFETGTKIVKAINIFYKSEGSDVLDINSGEIVAIVE